MKSGDELLAFAKLTSRRARIKGFEEHEVAVVMMTSAVELLFGVSWERASFISGHMRAYALQVAQEELINDEGRAGASAETLAELRNVAERGRANLEIHPMPRLVATAQALLERF